MMGKCLPICWLLLLVWSLVGGCTPQNKNIVDQGSKLAILGPRAGEPKEYGGDNVPGRASPYKQISWSGSNAKQNRAQITNPFNDPAYKLPAAPPQSKLPALPPSPPVQATKPLPSLRMNDTEAQSPETTPAEVQRPARISHYQPPPLSTPPPPAPPAENKAPEKKPAAPKPLPEKFKETAEPPTRLVPQPAPEKLLRPVSHAPAGEAAGSLRKLYQLATESYKSIDSYIVRFRRRERVNGQQMPEELMLLKFRKSPWSVYLKWLGKVGKGREVLYVKGRFKNQLHTKLAAGDIPLMPAGRKISLAPDSPLARAKSRHPITEAGIGNLIDQFGSLLEHVERGDNRLGTLKYIGMMRRPEFPQRVEAVLQIIPPKVEKSLPKGGRRFWFFDPRLRFPVLVITENENQQEVEYYCYDRFLFPGWLSDDEFNPNFLWPK